jgi:hypothetical protein
MTPLEELAQLASERRRRLLVAENDLNLAEKEGKNCVFILELPNNAPAAVGGRIGGIGERRIVKAYCFRQTAGNWIKVYETESSDKLERFDLPYHATGLSIVLPDGSEKVVSGVIDLELVKNYSEL